MSAVVPAFRLRLDSVSDSHNYRRHEAVARELERAFGHVPVSGVHVGRQIDRQERIPRPMRTPAHAEIQQTARTAMQLGRAKVRGQHMGRPSKLTPQQQAEARQRRAEGATLKELAKSYNVAVATIARLAK